MVPKDREGEFQTELFKRYQRSEKALVLAMVQMYVEPHAPTCAAPESSPDSAPATAPASSAAATPDTPPYRRHVVVSLFDYRDETSNGRCNKDASGQQA